MRPKPFICDHAGGHLVPLKYDQYDIRLEVRRSDAAERPRVETVARACKEHYGAVFDAALGRIREALTQESML